MGPKTLLKELRKINKEKGKLSIHRPISAEETTPLEDVTNITTIAHHDRPFHSSPKSPTPAPRDRSDTQVSIITPESCIYIPRPDSQ